MAASNGDDQEDLPTFIIGATDQASGGYAIPIAPPEPDSAKWLGYAESTQIAGVRIGKGFLYVGPSLAAPSGKTDPALIDLRKIVAPTGHYSERYPDERPSYSETSPRARRAYLLWLADGRSAPNADIGYVFLYFYGLERRIILDILRDRIGTGDFPNLYRELKRLYALYAGKSTSFRRHCAELIELIEADTSDERSYQHELVTFPTAWGFPFLIRLALGQAVLDGVPIPAKLALTWAEHDPAIIRHPAVSRCPVEFKALFMATYAAMHGVGFSIAPNRTKLKLSYQPASPGFEGSGGVDMYFGDTPDISALTGPVSLLQEVVDACAVKLDAFSRFLERDPGGRSSLEGILNLPVELWPDSSKTALESIRNMARNGPRLMSFSALSACFAEQGEFGKDQQQALFRALESEGLHSEPEVAGMGRAFTGAELLVLFDSSEKGVGVPVSVAYQVARLSVELAAAIAHADGDFCERELSHLNDSIARWEHLPASARMRLTAYACLLQACPVALSSMKSKIDSLDAQTRASVAAFAATMVLADGVASTAEVRLLEKIYQQLGLERVNVYSDIHSGGSAGVPQSRSAGPAESSGAEAFVLDAAKIAALQASSRLIAERLARIFADESEPLALAGQAPQDPPDSTSVMGLDRAHSAFARILTSRSMWQRTELVDIAADLAIMLDGALERLNEASLDELGIMFAEGDDPIEINLDIVEKLAQ